MTPIQEFDELYVISDLHLGGVKPRQIFSSGPDLAAFIEWVRNRPAQRNVALLINGDTVDFLAEDGAKAFDANGAITKLDRIAADSSFKPVFEALGNFVTKIRRQLVITLGNHDLELALPWVRAHFLEMLSGGSDAARGRITLAFDGAGYSCVVGGTSVLCVHGNEVDTWNVTDYERLRRTGRDLVQGRPVDEWTPNAGSKLVVEVMNEVKRNRPFVDLLKPEVEAVVPVLLAIDRSQANKLARVAAVASRLSWDKVRKMTGFLSAGEEPEEGSLTVDRRLLETADTGAALDRLLRDTFSVPATERGRRRESEALMDDIEDKLQRGVDPLDLVSREEQGEQLGIPGAVWGWIRGKPDHEVLREALQKLKEDRSFESDHPDSTFRLVDEYMGGGFDYIVTGHTHQEKRLRRQHGKGVYLNSGTWVGLMRFTKEVLESEQKFADVFKSLTNAKTIPDLEAKRLVERRPAVVSISTEGGAVQASLQRVLVAGDTVELKEVEGGTV